MENLVSVSPLRLEGREDHDESRSSAPLSLVKAAGKGARFYGCGDSWIAILKRKRDQPNVALLVDGELRVAPVAAFGELPVPNEAGEIPVLTANGELYAVDASGDARGVARFDDFAPIEMAGFLENGFAGLDLGGSFTVWTRDGDRFRAEGRFEAGHATVIRTFPRLNVFALEATNAVRIVHVADGDARVIGRFDRVAASELSPDGNRQWVPGGDALIGYRKRYTLQNVDDAIAARASCPALPLYDDGSAPDGIPLESSASATEARIAPRGPTTSFDRAKLGPHVRALVAAIEARPLRDTPHADVMNILTLPLPNELVAVLSAWAHHDTRAVSVGDLDFQFAPTVATESPLAIRLAHFVVGDWVEARVVDGSLEAIERVDHEEGSRRSYGSLENLLASLAATD